LQVAPRKKGRIYGVGSLQFETSSAYIGPPLLSDDPVLLSQKMAPLKLAFKLRLRRSIASISCLTILPTRIKL